MTIRQRTAQLAVWAGRVRKLVQQVAKETGRKVQPVFVEFSPLIEKIERIQEARGLGWIDALSPDWLTEWNTYIEYNRSIVAVEWPNSREAQLRGYFRETLRGLV